MSNPPKKISGNVTYYCNVDESNKRWSRFIMKEVRDLDVHELNNQGRGYLKSLPKSLGGFKAFRKNCQGGPPILGFISFLLTSVLKFAWGVHLWSGSELYFKGVRKHMLSKFFMGLQMKDRLIELLVVVWWKIHTTKVEASKRTFLKRGYSYLKLLRP